MYLEDKTVRLQLWDTAGQVWYNNTQKKPSFLNIRLFLSKRNDSEASSRVILEILLLLLLSTTCLVSRFV